MKKSTIDSFTDLTFRQERQEYGSVSMRTLILFNGKLALQRTGMTEHALVLQQISKMQYVPKASLDTLGGCMVQNLCLSGQKL